mgnify:CR=1 FL=1
MGLQEDGSYRVHIPRKLKKKLIGTGTKCRLTAVYVCQSKRAWKARKYFISIDSSKIKRRKLCQ